MPPWDPKNPNDLMLMPAELLKDAHDLQGLAASISDIGHHNYGADAKELTHTQIAAALEYLDHILYDRYRCTAAWPSKAAHILSSAAQQIDLLDKNF